MHVLPFFNADRSSKKRDPYVAKNGRQDENGNLSLSSVSSINVILIQPIFLQNLFHLLHHCHINYTDVKKNHLYQVRSWYSITTRITQDQYQEPSYMILAILDPGGAADTGVAQVGRFLILRALPINCIPVYAHT